MYNNYNPHFSSHNNASFYDPYNMYNNYRQCPCPYWGDTPACYPPDPNDWFCRLRDYGPDPFVIDIEKATEQNNFYRLALWTGEHLQLTLMSINVGDDIGLEVHPDVDQFIRIEEGQGLVMMGDSENNLNFQRRVSDDCVVLVPAGKWHNLVNTGRVPLKLYSIYAPPEHPHGTIHRTKEDAQMEEHSY